jgi:hypothetical protein
VRAAKTHYLLKSEGNFYEEIEGVWGHSTKYELRSTNGAAGVIEKILKERLEEIQEGTSIENSRGNEQRGT